MFCFLYFVFVYCLAERSLRHAGPQLSGYEFRKNLGYFSIAKKFFYLNFFLIAIDSLYNYLNRIRQALMKIY